MTIGINTGQNLVIIILIMRYSNYTKNISNIVDNTTRKLFKDKGFHIFKLMDEWGHIVSDHYAKYSFPRIIRKINKQNILEIEIYDSGIIFDLQYGKETLILDINNFFQEEIVSDIKFKLIEKIPHIAVKQSQNNKKIPNELNKLIELVSDDEIKKNLIKIALAIQSDSN